MAASGPVAAPPRPAEERAISNRETRTNIYVAAVAAGAILVSALAARVGPVLSDPSAPGLIAILTLLIALAVRFPLKVSPQADTTLFTVPLFMAAILLNPIEVALAGALGSLVSERLLKAPARVTVFNVSNSMTAGGLAGMVFFILGPDGPGVALTPHIALAALASALVLHATNLGLMLGLVTMLKKRGFWRIWKGTWASDAIQEGALLTLGLVGALVVSQAAWDLLLLAPFLVACHGHHRNVDEARQNTELAEQLDRRLEELKETQANLVHSARMDSVGTLPAGVAHQINNPVFGITGKAEILLRLLRHGDDEYLRSELAVNDVESIFRDGMRISTIVNHLLDYSHCSDDKRDARLDETMGSALQLLNSDALSKGVRVVRKYADEPTAMATRSQLEQVFVNILANAIHATPERGTIVMGCALEDGMATAYVTDSGSGIPLDIQDRVFEPFFTTKNAEAGAGLGLFVCHKILRDLRGEISIDSCAGRGTTVEVKLPIASDKSSEDAHLNHLAATVNEKNL